MLTEPELCDIVELPNADKCLEVGKVYSLNVLQLARMGIGLLPSGMLAKTEQEDRCAHVVITSVSARGFTFSNAD